jgi:6-phosphogluconolactonase
MKGELIVKQDIGALARWGAEQITMDAVEAVQERGVFRAALAGGSTPRALYTLLGSDPCRQRLPWKQTYWFFGDERYVPPTHSDSNVRMVRETLFRNIPSSVTNLYSIATEDPDPDHAAREYEDRIRDVFGEPSGVPVFDLVLLGMGTDGHTASLFPGAPALEEQTRLTAAVSAEQAHTRRVTLTLPTINAARRVVIFVAGAEKASIIRKVLEGRSERYPVQRVNPEEGELYWALDREAAREVENLSI